MGLRAQDRSSRTSSPKNPQFFLKKNFLDVGREILWEKQVIIISFIHTFLLLTFLRVFPKGGTEHFCRSLLFYKGARNENSPTRVSPHFLLSRGKRPVADKVPLQGKMGSRWMEEGLPSSSSSSFSSSSSSSSLNFHSNAFSKDTADGAKKNSPPFFCPKRPQTHTHSL